MKAKILYVDDEPINLQIFKLNFSRKYNVFTANNGFEGLDLLSKELDILVIISDMMMPGMNGLEFIKKAKAIYPDKRFCILTGFEITKEIQDAINTGLIIKYFSKPFDVKEIDETIIDVVE